MKNKRNKSQKYKKKIMFSSKILNTYFKNIDNFYCIVLKKKKRWSTMNMEYINKNTSLLK